MNYKCPVCHLMNFETNICPDCGNDAVLEMCDGDHKCTCKQDIHSSIAYCNECGHPVCPECGSHDVNQISRVTGYLSDVGGWNKAKAQELKDRTRVNIG